MITNEDQDGLKVWAEIESDLHFAELILSLKTETRSDVQRAVKLKGGTLLGGGLEGLARARLRTRRVRGRAAHRPPRRRPAG